MGRPRDEFYWEQVTKEDNGKWKCNRCGKKFKGGVSRIKAHLGNKKGQGIALCNDSSVPNNEGGNSTAMAMTGSIHPMEVVDYGINSFQVARQAHHTIDNSIPSSSNHQNVIPTNNEFEVARYDDQTMDDNITNLSNHQNVTPANNIFQVAGGAAHEVNYNYIEHSLNHQFDNGPIHTSQGLANEDHVVGNDNGGFEHEISEVKELIDLLTSEEGNIQRELQWLESRTGQKRRRQIEDDDWFEEVEELKERAVEMIDLLSGQGWSLGRSALELKMKELMEDVHTHVKAKPPVLSNELIVGESFDDNLDMLFALVRDPKTLLIGVHGMGGVGKTTLVTHFKNKILRDRYFKHVIWVTVSQDFSIFKLQSAIAKRMGIKLDEDDEIVERAQILSLALQKEGKSVLILDDVWNYIDLQKVGIPLRVNGIKLILTSRLKHVFQQMDCPPESIIPIETLSPGGYDGDWELFLLKLGCYGTPATLSHEVEKIARSIVERCNGLPLGISVMARIMKGVTDIRQWRHALYKLKNLAMGAEMEDEVFKSLKLSYDHLMDKNIQNCFLQCALCTDTLPNELIMKLVDEGLIKGMKSLEEIFDEGRTILDQLKGHSLLFDLDGYLLSMNGLVRDMASYVVKGRYMMKSGKRLSKIPDRQEWAHDLEKVSLLGSHIYEIPEGTSPMCPRLSTLILSYNKFSEIPNCFFKYMDSLTLLDLSHNEELMFLPDSLSSLRSLKSLLLEGCRSLSDVPPLGELRELSRLVISDTSILQVPKGLAMLMKLKWLDLSSNYKLTFVPGSVLFGLTNMQYLDLCSAHVTVEVDNVKEMSVLECFAGRFHVSKDFADYVENILDRGSGPKYYYLCFGADIMGSYIKPDLLGSEDRHYVHFGDCEAFNCLLPRDLHQLYISNNKQWRGGICDAHALSFKAPSSLRRISISFCPKLERLFCLSGSCSLCKHLHSLQSLYLSGLEGLELIWKESDGEGICLPNLSHLNILGCDKMEKLLTPVTLQQLPKLQQIYVRHCESIKEIFATRRRSDEEDDNIDSTITLPSTFKKLTLHGLPQLKTVCTDVIVSESPPTLSVSDCPKLTSGSLRYKSSHSDPNTVILL